MNKDKFEKLWSEYAEIKNMVHEKRNYSGEQVSIDSLVILLMKKGIIDS